MVAVAICFSPFHASRMCRTTVQETRNAMQIDSSTTSLSLLTPLTSTSSTSATSAISATDLASSTDATDSVSGGSDQTNLSKMGQLFSKLQNLESTDPSKAKQVLSSIADSLSAKASEGGNTDSHLQELADKFKQAASTGDLSGLKPPSGHGHGHGHGHRAEAPPPTSSTDNSSSSTDSSSSDSTTSAASATTSAATRYRQHGDNPFAQVESIISNALSSANVA